MSPNDLARALHPVTPWAGLCDWSYVKAMNEWEKLLESEVGTVFHDSFDEGVRFIILRGPASVCAYLGVPASHPLAGHDYDSLSITCHGGLTYSNEGDGKYLPKDFWWYGWDYCHAGDANAFASESARAIDATYNDRSDHRWTPSEVVKDAWEAKYDFQKLIKLSEAIRNRRP